MKCLIKSVTLLVFSVTIMGANAQSMQHEDENDRFHCEKSIANNPYAISFYKPTYLLVYHRSSPIMDVRATASDNQKRSIGKSEVVFQFSIQAPVWNNILNTRNSLNIAYSQISFWQAYVKSEYFRESNYQPEIFIKNQFFKSFEFYLGASHESNGLGGQEERSWNRAFVDVRYITDHFMVSLMPWVLIFKAQSVDLHNPDITDFLGYGRLLVAINFKDITLNLQVRNAIESAFSHGAIEIHMSFPLTKKIRLFARGFSGYGQNLIEYNHYTNSLGIGIGLSDYLLQI